MLVSNVDDDPIPFSYRRFSARCSRTTQLQCLDGHAFHELVVSPQFPIFRLYIARYGAWMRFRQSIITHVQQVRNHKLRNRVDARPTLMNKMRDGASWAKRDSAERHLAVSGGHAPPHIGPPTPDSPDADLDAIPDAEGAYPESIPEEPEAPPEDDPVPQTPPPPPPPGREEGTAAAPEANGAASGAPPSDDAGADETLGLLAPEGASGAPPGA